MFHFLLQSKRENAALKEDLKKKGDGDKVGKLLAFKTIHCGVV